MEYTAKKLAKTSGVSVRTLHYYDEIGLLKPAYRSQNRYRVYLEEQVFLLQQILFFRELGFELKEIRTILTSGNFSKIAALNSHKLRLIKQNKRIEGLLKTIDNTIEHLKGEKQMASQELFKGFDAEKQKEYEEYLVENYGLDAEDSIAESKRRTKHWQKADWDRHLADSTALTKEIAALLKGGLSADSDQTQALMKKHWEMINLFYTPTKKVYIGLGELYVNSPDFVKYYEAFHPKLPQYLHEGMKAFAERELS